jgi:hypothetical protein
MRKDVTNEAALVHVVRPVFDLNNFVRETLSQIAGRPLVGDVAERRGLRRDVLRYLPTKQLLCDGQRKLQ